MSVPVANFESWNRGEVMTFFEAYDFDQDEIKKIRDLGLRGLMLPDLSEAKLVGWGLDPVLASYIFSIIKAAGILSESGLDKPPKPIDSTSEFRRIYLESLSPGPPSSQAVPAIFAKLQGTAADCDPKFYCNRPSWASSTPVTLLDPTFGEFVDDCKSYKPTEEDNAFVLELSASMSEFWSTEKLRADAFRSLLLKHYNIQLYAADVPNTSYQTDGHACILGYPFLITKAKREVGSGGSDPYLQVALYYFEFLRTLAAKTPSSVLPCFNIFYFGPFLGFSGSLITRTKIHMDILAPILPLCWQRHDVEMRVMAARFFGAFNLAIKKLMHYYQNTLQTLQVQPQVEFPYKSEYQSLEDHATIVFKYEYQPMADKLLFFGETKDGSKKCIKFTRSYSKDVHLCCAIYGCAPTMRGFEIIPGGWYMVIMDTIDLNIYRPYSNRTTDIRFPDAARLCSKVTEVVKHLHRQGLVHGDLRDTNLLVRTDGELGFMVVDFDWAGKEGEVTYPINVNHIDIKRPDGARDGLPIQKAHDLEMLDRMFGTCAETHDLSCMDEDSQMHL